MTRFPARRLLLLGPLLLAACAEGARSDRMVPAAPSLPDFGGSALRQAIALTEVLGGQETDPMLMANVGNAEFAAALREALARAGLLAPDPDRAPFRLRAALVDVTLPRSGFTTTVDAAVRYVLTRSGGVAVLDELVTADFTLGAGDVFYGVERLRAVKEGAIRANIARFLARLAALDTAPPAPRRQ